MTNEYNPDGKEIRFIDSHYKDLFHIPDGSCVQIHYPDEMVVKPCTFIDEYHTQIGYNVFHICQFAEIMERNGASIFVEKELQRVNREAMADLDGKDIMFKFPPTFASTHTALVLKTPKTKTSVRKVFLPKTVAEMLVQRKADIEELKDLFGDEFVDFNLVFCSSNGKPIEGQVINRAFNKLIEEKGLPKVVFHSLRHSSITYKLKLNGGDMKSVQGDSGHAQVKMVADVYSHIIDDDRRLNAERMEAAFYSGRQATPEPVQPAATESSADDKELLLKLLQNPEMAALLKSLAKTL